MAIDIDGVGVDHGLPWHVVAVSTLAAVPDLLRFRPSPNFAALMADDARSILVRGPNRIGKSRHLAYLVARNCVRRPGQRWRLVSPTGDHVQLVAGRYLAEFLAPYLNERRSYYVQDRGWNGGRSRQIVLANGSAVELRALSDEVTAHSGQALHGVVMDEPPSRAHYIENAARLGDYRGQMIIGATMVNAPVEWLRNMVEGDEASPTEGRTEHATGWVQYVASLNTKGCPWYSQEQIDELVGRFRSDPTEYAQRALGAWEGVTEDRHFWAWSDRCISSELPPKPKPNERRDWVVGLGLDHGSLAKHSTCVVGAYQERTGRAWLLGAIQSRWGTTWDQQAQAIIDELRDLGITPDQVGYASGDITTFGGARHTGWRINEALEHAIADLCGRPRSAPPFRIRDPDKTPGSVDWGLRAINAQLERKRLTVHPRARLAIEAFRMWNQKEGSQFIHMVDAIRYWLVGLAGHRPELQSLRFK